MKKILLPLLLLFIGFSQTYSQNPPPGLDCQGMRTWLRNTYYTRVAGDTFNYDQARLKMYGWIDNIGDSVECVYSGYKYRNDHGVETLSLGPGGTEMNTEHSVPQSFFNDMEPMKSDIHHLYPTYPQWNTLRSNYRYADIPDNETNQWLLKKVSTTTMPVSNINLYTEYKSSSSPNKWEPRESVKGDIARGVMYFYAMYEHNVNVAQPISDVADIALLLQWNTQDPVDALEHRRDSLINFYQKNHNPFVLHPEWCARAFSPTNNCSVGIENHIAGLEGIKLFPNPAQNELYISGYSSSDINALIQIVNPLGMVVYEDPLHWNGLGLIRRNLDISKLPTGLYFVHLSNDDGQFTKTFIKQ